MKIALKEGKKSNKSDMLDTLLQSLQSLSFVTFLGNDIWGPILNSVNRLKKKKLAGKRLKESICKHFFCKLLSHWSWKSFHREKTFIHFLSKGKPFQFIIKKKLNYRIFNLYCSMVILKSNIWFQNVGTDPVLKHQRAWLHLFSTEREEIKNT